jgi:tRNA(Ile)-lysidine synthase
MTEVERRILLNLELLGIRDADLLVAFSGGVDSVVLLDVLSRNASSFNLNLFALHVHHGLHPDADEWSDFCLDFCNDRNINAEVVKVSVNRQSKKGLEGEARSQRYAALLGRDSEFIALAHHFDDQVETFMLKIGRGAGLDGLTGMKPMREDFASGKKLIRPMLQVHRSEIEQYARDRNLMWVEDDSNRDLSFDRNYLRYSLLPDVRRRLPAFNAGVRSVIENLGDALELVSEVAGQDIEALECEGGGIDLERLGQFSYARQKNIILELFKQQGLEFPSRAQVAEALRQCHDAQSSAMVNISTSSGSIRRYRKKLFVLPKQQAVDSGWSQLWNGRDRVVLPSGLGVLEFRPSHGEGLSIKSDEVGKVAISFAVPRGRFSLGIDRPQRSLKKIWQAMGIPPWRRGLLPLVHVGSRIAYVGDVGVSGSFFAEDGEKSWQVVWTRE